MRDLVQEPVLTSDPMRHFTRCRDRRHRSGPQFLTSIGRRHDAKSLAKSRMPLALDFAGDVMDVVSQPLKVSFATCGKRRAHTPDYLAVTRRGIWPVDVHPEPLVKEADRESFAPATEVAIACGWRYTVATRYDKRHYVYLGTATAAALTIWLRT
ncbi:MULTISPECIES: hypothetical protein [unclassified Streptomyces]|uniref:hypothetical protein n=1 Tax=unclassified Streptomyces TaxID=2593676 RepID=UPI0035E37A29